MTIKLCCPLCLGFLKKLQENLHCVSCKTEFPVVMGIPDLRISGPLEEEQQTDLKDALYLAGYGKNKSLDEVITENAKLSNMRKKRNVKLIDLYKRMSLSAEEREFNRFKEMKLILKKFQVTFPSYHVALDLGTGMGPAIPYLAGRFNHVIAVDISLKHLVISKKRCQERGYNNVTHVCACAEKLPFREFSFSFINSSDVLEHVSNNILYIKEIERVLEKEGILWASTPNRFTILPEGHVRLWGVGFFPRGIQKYYVKIIRNTNYEGIHPVSFSELTKLISNFFKKYQVILPIDIHGAILPHPGIKASRLWKIAKIYWEYNNRHRRIRKVGYFLEKIFYPQFRFFAIKY